MSRFYTYHNWFQILEEELRQQKELGDLADRDTYRVIPYETGKRYINEILRDMVLENPFIFQKMFTYTFTSSASTLLIPENIYKIQMIKYQDSWKDIEDYLSAGHPSTGIYAISPNELYNPEGWNLGDTLEMKVVMYPTEISFALPSELADTTFVEGTRTGDQDEIQLDKSFIRYLTLLCKRRGISKQSGTDLSTSDLTELAEAQRRFQQVKGQVKRYFTIGFKGQSFGR